MSPELIICSSDGDVESVSHWQAHLLTNFAELRTFHINPVELTWLILIFSSTKVAMFIQEINTHTMVFLPQFRPSLASTFTSDYRNMSVPRRLLQDNMLFPTKPPPIVSCYFLVNIHNTPPGGGFHHTSMRIVNDLSTSTMKISHDNNFRLSR